MVLGFIPGHIRGQAQISSNDSSAHISSPHRAPLTAPLTTPRLTSAHLEHTTFPLSLLAFKFFRPIFFPEPYSFRFSYDNAPESTFVGSLVFHYTLNLGKTWRSDLLEGDLYLGPYPNWVSLASPSPGVFHAVYILLDTSDFRLVINTLQYSTSTSLMTQTRTLVDNGINSAYPIFATIACQYRTSCLLMYGKNGALKGLNSTDPINLYLPQTPAPLPGGIQAVYSTATDLTFSLVTSPFVGSMQGYYFATTCNSTINLAFLNSSAASWTPLATHNEGTAKIGLLSISALSDRVVLLFKYFKSGQPSFDIRSYTYTTAFPVFAFPFTAAGSNSSFLESTPPIEASSFAFNSTLSVAAVSTPILNCWTLSYRKDLWGNTFVLPTTLSNPILTAATPGANDTFIMAWTLVGELNTNSSALLASISLPHNFYQLIYFRVDLSSDN